MSYQRPEWERYYIRAGDSRYIYSTWCYLHTEHIFKCKYSRNFNFGFTTDTKLQLGVI